MEKISTLVKKVFTTVCVLCFLAFIIVLAISIISGNWMTNALITLGIVNVVLYLIIAVVSKLKKLSSHADEIENIYYLIFTEVSVLPA